MYIEASSPRTKGHKSWLQSKVYTPTLGRCLSFWYHMYGQDVGNLNILIKTSNTSYSAPMWTLSGNQGNVWKPTRVTIRSASNHRVSTRAYNGHMMGALYVYRLRYYFLDRVCGLRN